MEAILQTVSPQIYGGCGLFGLRIACKVVYQKFEGLPASVYNWGWEKSHFGLLLKNSSVNLSAASCVLEFVDCCLRFLDIFSIILGRFFFLCQEEKDGNLFTL